MKIKEILKMLFIKIPLFVVFIMFFCFSSSSKEYKNYIIEEKYKKEYNDKVQKLN